MKIRGMEIWPVRMPYRKAFTTSRGTVSDGISVLLRLHTDVGLTGAGEASLIFTDQSNETLESIVEVLANFFAPLLIGRDPFDIEEILEDLGRVSDDPYGFPYSKCAVDHALYDLMGKWLGIPVHQLIGGAKRRRIGVSRSLAVQPLEELVEDARAKQAEGYRMLTLKGSSDPSGDIERFLAVRDAVGAEMPLEIDPNQAWSADETLAVISALDGRGLYAVEQPCPWWDLDSMAEVTRKAPVTIAADESVLSPADVLEVVGRKAAHMITIKLACSGGIHLARRKVAIAEAAGLVCNMGSKHTLGVGTAAIVHFASATPVIQEPIGYGSPLERFVDDVIHETIPFRAGTVEVWDQPGLGISLNEANLKRYAAGSYRQVGHIDRTPQRA